MEVTQDTLRVDRQGKIIDIPLPSIIDYPEETSGRFWGTIHLRTNNGTHTIRGFSIGSQLAKFTETLTESIIKAHLDAHEQDMLEIESAYSDFMALCTDRWMKVSEMISWTVRHRIPAPNRTALSSITLAKTTEYRQQLVEKYIYLESNYDSVRNQFNQDFLKQAKIGHSEYFDSVESNPLTERQREACIKDEDNNLVLAGAGSGKTSVIIGKAGFIERMKWAEPEEVLILAFGNKASKETQERISEKLGKDSRMKASTFHALGLHIIGQSTGHKPSLHKSVENDDARYSMIDGFVSDFSNRRKNYREDLVNYFANYLYTRRELIH